MKLEGRFLRLGHDPGDPMVTSHCPFCGSGQVTGRSDGTIDCAFCGMNYIVRVQPAFPGMPQQPMGPGALTDIGPEMGPMGGMGMDPMMGMEEGPPGEGMPPGMEGDEGAPPFGEEEDEGEGPPFGDEDDEGEDEGDEGGSPFPPEKKDSGSKPKPKSKKASFDPEDLREDRHDDDHDDDDDDWEPEYEPPAERYGHEGSKGYRTLAGDHLDEARYIRHLAVLHSGGDPRVLARLRMEAGDAWLRDHMQAYHSPAEDASSGDLLMQHAHDHGPYGGWHGVELNRHRHGVEREELDRSSSPEGWEFGGGGYHDFVARKTANSPDAEIRGGKRQHQWLYPVPGSYDWQPSTGGLEHRAHARRCANCGLEGRAYPGPQGGLTWRYARSVDYKGKPEREHADWSECPGRTAARKREPEFMSEEEYHGLTGRKFGDYTGYYHGTNQELHPGQLLTPRGADKAGRWEHHKTRAHVYFSGSLTEADDYARQRSDYNQRGRGRVYAVYPLDDFTEDREGDWDNAFKTKGRLLVSHEIPDEES